MKPITYWIQNDAVNQLVDLFGPDLEKLSPINRRQLIACLANDTYYWPGQDPYFDEAYELVEYLTQYEKDLLIEAIAASLTHKKGTP